MNSKVTALCGRNRSAVLTYIYIHAHTSSSLLESEDDEYTHTQILTLDLACTNAHNSGRVFRTLPGALSLHTQTSSYLLDIWLMIIVAVSSISAARTISCCMVDNDTYIATHPYPHLIACTYTHSSSTLTGAFLLHACSPTRNWRTNFTSVRRVFLVVMVVLQTVLLDNWAWSVRFLHLKLTQSWLYFFPNLCLYALVYHFYCHLMKTWLDERWDCECAFSHCEWSVII